MPKTLLQRLLRRPDGRVDSAPAFSLPGALQDGVRLLIVDSGEITDLLFAMPFIEQAKNNYKDAHIGLLCDERCSGLALSSGVFADLIVYDEEQLKEGSPAAIKLDEILAQERWDIAVLVGKNPDPAREHLAFASRANLRVGPGHDGAFPDLNCELRPLSEGRHPYKRTTTWGRLLGVPLEGVPLRWPLAEEGVRQMAQLIHFNKPRKDQLLLGVDPGIGKAGTVLAAENLAFLVNHLSSHVRSKTILLTADEDAERQEALRSQLRSELLELPRPTLRETVLLLSQCDLFLAGNSDLLHFAVAMGVPTVGVFTVADGEEWVPPDIEKLEIVRPQEGEALSLSDLMTRVDRLLR